MKFSLIDGLMIVRLSNIIRQTMNEIAQAHSHARLSEILIKTSQMIEPLFDYQSQQYRTIKRLTRKVEYNRHSHRQDYYQLRAEVISSLGRMVS